MDLTASGGRVRPDCRIASLATFLEDPRRVEGGVLCKSKDAGALLKANEVRIVHVPHELSEEAERAFTGLVEHIRLTQKMGQSRVPPGTDDITAIRALKTAGAAYEEAFSFMDGLLRFLKQEGLRVTYDVFHVETMEDVVDDLPGRWLATIYLHTVV